MALEFNQEKTSSSENMLDVCFVSNKGKVSLELDSDYKPELIDIQCFCIMTDKGAFYC